MKEAYYVLERSFIFSSDRPLHSFGINDINENIIFGYFQNESTASSLIDELQRRHHQNNPNLVQTPPPYRLQASICMSGSQIYNPDTMIVIAHDIGQESVPDSSIIHFPDFSSLEKLIVRRRPCRSISPHRARTNGDLCWGHVGTHQLHEDIALYKH